MNTETLTWAIQQGATGWTIRAGDDFLAGPYNATKAGAMRELAAYLLDQADDLEADAEVEAGPPPGDALPIGGPLWRDYRPETKDLLERMVAAGFVLLSGNNGGDPDEDFAHHGNLDAWVEDLTAADHADLWFGHPEYRSSNDLWLRIVLGNSPGELVCDWKHFARLDMILEQHSEAWEGKEQPMRPAGDWKTDRGPEAVQTRAEMERLQEEPNTAG